MESSREKQLVSEVEFKPELRLGIRVETEGYQEWLDREGLAVNWIASVWLYDNRVEYFICSANPFFKAERITTCYDSSSLQDRKERDYGGGETLQSWFESQIDDDDRTVDNFAGFLHSILLYDAASGVVARDWIPTAEPGMTCGDLWDEVKESLLEAIASNSREFVLNLFPQIDKLTSA